MVLVFEDLRGPPQNLDDVGIVVLLQVRNQRPADPVAGEALVRIRGILPKSDTALGGIGLDRGTLEGQQGPQITSIAQQLHASQAGGPAPAQKTQEHGFRLITGLVSQSDFLTSHFPGHLVEEPVAQRTRRLFERQALSASVLSDIEPTPGTGQPTPPGSGRHKIAVSR